MSSSASESSAGPRSRELTAVVGAAAPNLIAFTIVLLLLLYGYEIFNFSLSIDEEWTEVPWVGFVMDGRWTTGLLVRAFPPMGNIPMISTVLFCAGLFLTESPKLIWQHILYVIDTLYVKRTLSLIIF